MKRIAFCLLAVVALAAMALAADLSGAWSGTFTLGDSDSRAAYMVLKQTGANLAGTAGPSSDEQWPIEGAKVEGNKLSFLVHDPEGNVYRVALSPDGDKLSGDLTAEMNGQTVKGKISFTRAK